MVSKVYVITWKEFEDGGITVSFNTPVKVAVFAKEADADHCFVQRASSKDVCTETVEKHVCEVK